VERISELSSAAIDCQPLRRSSAGRVPAIAVFDPAAPARRPCKTNLQTKMPATSTGMMAHFGEADRKNAAVLTESKPQRS
jgi:hypothetical protein